MTILTCQINGKASILISMIIIRKLYWVVKSNRTHTYLSETKAPTKRIIKFKYGKTLSNDSCNQFYKMVYNRGVHSCTQMFYIIKSFEHKVYKVVSFCIEESR